MKPGDEGAPERRWWQNWAMEAPEPLVRPWQEVDNLQVLPGQEIEVVDWSTDWCRFCFASGDALSIASAGKNVRYRLFRWDDVTDEEWEGLWQQLEDFDLLAFALGEE